jgi:DNA-binding CsgD family transcriptional regulator
VCLMQKLNTKDLGALASAAGGLDTRTDFRSPLRVMIGSKRQLVPCEISAYNESDAVTNELGPVRDNPMDDAEEGSPDFERAWRNTRALMLAREQAEGLSRALGYLRHGIAFLDRSRRITWMTELAREWLQTYFPIERAVGRRLPETLRSWLKRLAAAMDGEAAENAREPLVISRGDRRLRVRWVSESGDVSWLVLSEEDESRSVADLAQLGLTKREAQILHWMAEGKSNPEIGIIVGSSANTVRKHVEHILEKLSVETRAAAVRRVWDMRMAA